MDQSNSSQHRFWSLLSKKLSGEAGSEELQELQMVLLSNPDLHHYADMLTEMWEQQKKNNNTASEAAYMRHIMKHKDEFFDEESQEQPVHAYPFPEERKSFFSKKRLTGFSFVVIIMVAIGAIYVFTRKNQVETVAVQAMSSVTTKNGNRTKIVLPDGSQVWLNAGSNLDYNNEDFNKNIREVSLNGEAYFDIVKNADKPFIIHTKKMDIKVIGTAFNVRSYNNEKTAEASLIRGTIEVTLKDRKDQKIILNPNEKISVANEEQPEKAVKTGEKIAVKETNRSIPPIQLDKLKPNPVINIIPEIAWTDNRLFFEDESLEDLSPLLERWFGKPVIVQNESLKRNRYRGNFKNETIENVLSYLKFSKPFNFKFENDTVVIY
jgi:transmembrane sensor